MRSPFVLGWLSLVFLGIAGIAIAAEIKSPQRDCINLNGHWHGVSGGCSGVEITQIGCEYFETSWQDIQKIGDVFLYVAGPDDLPLDRRERGAATYRWVNNGSALRKVLSIIRVRDSEPNIVSAGIKEFRYSLDGDRMIGDWRDFFKDYEESATDHTERAASGQCVWTRNDSNRSDTESVD